MRNIQAVLSLCVVILALFLQPAQADAQNKSTPSESFEFMCRSKAKEIAAETYSTCMTDNRQAELERIRQEYQSELAEIKAKYESEIKGLSNDNTAEPPKTESTINNKKRVPVKNLKTKSRKTKVEASTAGLKDMPAKKMKTSKVKVERIDFSSPEESNETIPLQSRLSSDSNLTEPEIVEIPVQQE